ncbi:potassium channel [Balamuthia mandrillaris]
MLADPSSKLLMAILCGLVTLVMMASLIFVVENATLNRPHTGGLVTLLDAVYFIMVMSATVGFGDITPTSELGKLFVIVFIILAIILFPFFFTTIKSAFEQFQVERQYRGPSQHIVVCGYSSTLLDFFMEFYHAGREYIPTKALILAEKKLPTRLQRFFDEPYLSSRVDLLRGKPTSEFDLKRAKLQTSSMCVLLSNGSSEEDDIAVTLGALSVQHFNLAQTILAHVNSLRCKNLLVRANIRNVICEEELKLGLIAQSCVCPGFSTLLGNLLRTFAANQVLESRSRHHLKHMHYMMHSYRSHPPTSPWEQAYERSLGMSICSLERMTALHGLRFVEAVRLCVHYFGCLLIGVRRKTSSTAFYQQPRFDGIVLNPSGEYVIQQGDEGIFITQSRSELLCIEQWEQGRFSRAAMQRRFSQGTRAGWDRVKQRLRRTLPLKSDPQAIRAFIRRCRKETTGRHYRSFSDYEEEEEEEEEEEGVSFSVRSRPTTGSGGMYGTFDQTVRRDVRYHLIPNQKEEKEEMEEEEHGTTGNQVPLLESGKEGVGEEVMEDVSVETGGSASLDILKDILTEEATGQAAPIRRYSHLITSDRRSLHDCTITDVREEPIFRNKNFNHVVITGNLVGIARFILRLRASDMGGALSEPKPIVVLSPELPSSSLWKSISIFPRVYFVQGQQLDRDDLRRCGVEHAAQIVIISKGVSSSSDKHKSEDEKADSCSDATAVLMYRLLQTMSCHHSFIFLSIRDVTSSKYLPGQKAGRDREPDFIRHPLYTSGRIYYDGLLTTLISQACFQPGIISIVRSLISHQVFLLRVSSFAMQGLVFGEALEELLENSDLLVVGLFRTEFKFDRNKEDEDEEEEQPEEESDRFLLGTTGLVEQTGLYQAGSSGKQPSYNRRYVMTNPTWDMVLRASDCLFVMAPNNVVH